MIALNSYYIKFCNKLYRFRKIIKIIILINLIILFSIINNNKNLLFFENGNTKEYCKKYGLLVYDYHYSLTNPLTL